MSSALASASPTTPLSASGGYAVPADTVRHTRTWMAWPDSSARWGRELAGVQADIALLAKTIAKYEPVVMCANPASGPEAKRACGSAVTVIGTIPVDDCWMRDSGPVFRTDGAGGVDAVGLSINGWGDQRPQTHGSLVAGRVAAYTGVAFSTAYGASEVVWSNGARHQDRSAPPTDRYVCNGAVIAPRSGDRAADAAARTALQRAYPSRAVEQLTLPNLGAAGGGIHHATCRQPVP